MDIEYQASPFPHVLVVGPVRQDYVEKVLSLLNRASWCPKSHPAYCYECADAEDVARLLDSCGAIGAIYDKLSQKFAISDEPASVDIQKYVNGSGLAAHTDNGTSEVRVVINFNTGWTVHQGGIWILADSANLGGARRYLPPLNNCGFAFETNATSFHALTTVQNAIQYAVVIAFHLVRAI